MTNEQLAEATEVLVWFAMQATTLPLDEDRARMELAIELTRSYLVDYQFNLARGASAADALANTAKGTTDITAAIAKHKQSLN